MRAYVLSMQQQEATDDEIYEVLNTMCNEIGCPLKFYEDKITPFEDTSGADAAEQRKVPFEDTSGTAEAAQQKVDKEASDASSWVSKEFSNKCKCIEI